MCYKFFSTTVEEYLLVSNETVVDRETYKAISKLRKGGAKVGFVPVDADIKGMREVVPPNRQPGPVKCRIKERQPTEPVPGGSKLVVFIRK